MPNTENPEELTLPSFAEHLEDARLYSVEFRRNNMPFISVPHGQDLDILAEIATGGADYVKVHDQAGSDYPIDIELGPNGGFIQLQDVGLFASIPVLRATMQIDQGGTDNFTLLVQRNLASDPNLPPYSTSFTARASDNPDRLYSINCPTWANGPADSYHTVGFQLKLLNRSGGGMSIPAGSRLAVWIEVLLQQEGV